MALSPGIPIRKITTNIVISPELIAALVPLLLPPLVPLLAVPLLPVIAPILPALAPVLVPTVIPSLVAPLVPVLAPALLPIVVPSLVPLLTPLLVPTLTPVLVSPLLPVLVPALVPTLVPELTPVLLPALIPNLITPVVSAILPLVVSSFNTRVGAITLLSSDVTGALGFIPAPALGFTPENIVNKSTNGTLSENSDLLYPSQKATKTYVDISISAIQGAPFSDATAILKGSVDPTKLLRIEVDGFTTATTRVLTPPNANATISGLEIAQTFSALNTFSSGIAISGGSIQFTELTLIRDAANQLALRNGSTAQEFHIYHTWSSGTSFERLNAQWAANTVRLWTEKGSGGGTARDFVLGADATELIRFQTGGKLAFFAGTPAVQQISGANLTNNVTVGGVNDTIANYTSLSVYSTDAAAIRNNIYQLARKLKQVNDALRLYGILT